jgi:hypothetical protein
VSLSEQIHPAARRPRAGRALAATAAVLLLGLGAAACSDDDGADVRSSGPGASGSGSASGTGSGSGSAVAGECEAVDGTVGVADADTTVAVTLDEFSITVDPSDAPAGAVGFSADNAGEEPHELVIAKGAPSDIEVVDGAPDEEALGDDLVGEIEAFAAGDTCEGTFELDAGDYVLFCALVETADDGSVESHFEEGMVTTFTVG